MGVVVEVVLEGLEGLEVFVNMVVCHSIEKKRGEAKVRCRYAVLSQGYSLKCHMSAEIKISIP